MTRGGGTVLVTGASAGIGRELALFFAERGHDLIVVARRQTELEQLADEILQETEREATVLPADLLAPSAAESLLEQVEELGLEVDVLVNNAGVLEAGAFVEQDFARIERMLQLNVLALTSLAHRCLGPMVERGTGRILNVASLGAFQPVPGIAAYAATKAYVLSLTEALSQELRGTGVTVSALCPGVTDTDMVSGASEQVDMDVPPGLAMTPRAVAEAGYRACMAGRVIEVPGVANELVANWTRFQPRWLVRGVAGFFGRGLYRRG